MERCAHVYFLTVLFLFLCCLSSCLGYRLAAKLFHLVPSERDVMNNISKFISASSTKGTWNATTDPCYWVGVRCYLRPSSVVTSLSLSGFGLLTTNTSLVPHFFDLVCRLDHLKSLNLSGLSLTTIPSSFFSNCSGLSELESIDLYNNELTGPLPRFSSFLALKALDLSYNYFYGAIDFGLKGLFRLRILNLADNIFNSTIPARVGGATALSLKYLILSNNHFHGEIPTGLFDYKNITWLDLGFNKLTGSVPDGIEGLSKVKGLRLSSNFLTGEIPSGISRCLTFLDLSSNKFNGEIPSDLLSPPTLKFADLTGNLLQGPIPMNLSPALRLLRLGGNSLNDKIPPTIGLLSNLTNLELEGNKLGPVIPSQLQDCQNLQTLILASNGLQGALPRWLCNLQRLKALDLRENGLSEIPNEFFKPLCNWTYLDLSHNLLTGEIPHSINSLRYLTELNLSSNLYSGPIPSYLSELLQLEILDLSNNSFSGQIPYSLATMQSLRNLYLSNNQLSAMIPYTLPQLKELQLGNNKLSGTVPRMPNSLEVALNLSSNHFHGLIPSQLGDLLNLKILDLSHNNFSGEVPTSLTRMPSLTLLVLSDNQLSGDLPPFPSYVSVITNGNRELNSNREPNISTGNETKIKISNVFIMIGAFVGGIFVSVLTCATIQKCLHRRKSTRRNARGPAFHSNRLFSETSIERSRRFQHRQYARNLR